jgi:hypothetical protein
LAGMTALIKATDFSFLRFVMFAALWWMCMRSARVTVDVGENKGVASLYPFEQGVERR